MKFYQKMALLCLLLVGCGHKSHVDSTAHTRHEAPSDYQLKLYSKDSSDFHRDSQSGREPSNTDGQLQMLKARLGDLNKLKPGKFEVFVFPKVSQLTHKESSAETEIILGKPQVNEVSVVAVTDCQYLIKNKGFSKYSAQAYFPPALAQTKKKCAIIEVTSRAMRDLNKSLLREGDEMSKRIYLDDSYVVYGLETDFYERNQKQNVMNLKTVGMKFANGAPTSSALGFLPIDMPLLSRIQKSEKVKINSVFNETSNSSNFTFRSDGKLIDSLALRQIARINRNFKTPQCSLHKLSYKDYYRESVKMYWCEGLPWPQVVENSHFVAVTQNISVR